MSFAQMPELKDVVDLVVKAFPEKLQHIESNRLLYASFSRKTSRVKGRICPISPRYEIFLGEAVYILEVHLESWEKMSEGIRLYVILHELLHIPEMGFQDGSKQYKHTIRHNVEDFRDLIKEYGVDMENVEKLAKQVNEVVKK
jgi:predicted metallopeptidase